MIKNYLNVAVDCLVVLLIASCKDMYDLPDEVKNQRLLVVEGFLNSGTGPTTIRLSQTVDIKDTTNIKPEPMAVVTVEGEDGSSYSLSENTNGEYSNAQLPLNANQQYRLRIKTTENKEYLSDYVPVLNTPPIDSISWQRIESGIEPGIQIYVNTHDPKNNTRYYRWEYNETWEFHSPYLSNVEYINGSFVARPDPEKIFICWKSEASNHVLVGSSAKLAQDVISLAPVTVIPSGSIKLTVRYSILIKQYALTKEAYDYWDILKKNTEQVGTLFDPQPSQLISNIHCVSTPGEEVIGYISADSTTEKRFFITKSEVEPWIHFKDCDDEQLVEPKDYDYLFGGRILLPTRKAVINGFVVGFYGAAPGCVDCTLIGTNVKPSFW